MTDLFIGFLIGAFAGIASVLIALYVLINSDEKKLKNTP